MLLLDIINKIRSLLPKGEMDSSAKDILKYDATNKWLGELGLPDLNIELEHQLKIVSLGSGCIKNMTFAAAAALRGSDKVYIMAGEDTWMVQVLLHFVGRDNIRSYMPKSVKWTQWHNDPVLDKIALEIQNDLKKGLSLCLAVAGDVAIYSNFYPLAEKLEKKAISWEVIPGVSFLNALSVETKKPLVGEGQQLLIGHLDHGSDLNSWLKIADVIALYSPNTTTDLEKNINSSSLKTARAIVVSNDNRKPQAINLLKAKKMKFPGITLLERTIDRRADINKLDEHFGQSAWDSQGRLFAVRYPNELWWSEGGDVKSLKFRYRIPGPPFHDPRCLFIDSNDSLYISVKNPKGDPFAQTLKSVDQGNTFKRVIDRCFWGMDQDSTGRIYGGVYHENNEPDAQCTVFVSCDQGQVWYDISSPSWHKQNHVHGLGIDPSTGWIYANLGDVDELDGCWRSKGIFSSVTEIGSEGECYVKVDSVEGFEIGDCIVICIEGKSICAHISNVKLDKLYLSEDIEFPFVVGGQSFIFKNDWILKFQHPNVSFQFTGIAFKGDSIYLADDNGGKKNPDRVVVHMAADDGADNISRPSPALCSSESDGWGAFFICLDNKGVLWTGVRPYAGAGRLWRSEDGKNWESVLESKSEDLPLWRGTHTLRDATRGQVGDGRNLTSVSGGIIVPMTTSAIRLK